MIWVLAAHMVLVFATQMVWVPYTPFEMGYCSNHFDASLAPHLKWGTASTVLLHPYTPFEMVDTAPNQAAALLKGGVTSLRKLERDTFPPRMTYDMNFHNDHCLGIKPAKQITL